DRIVYRYYETYCTLTEFWPSIGLPIFVKQNINIRAMNISLEDRHAIVCGSTQGIGLAIAHALAGLGATCILLARNADKLHQAVSTLPDTHGQRHHYEVADFSDLDAVGRAINRIIDVYAI